MKPELIMLMISSLDGRLHPSRWTSSPDGGRVAWGTLYEEVQESFQADGWIVGRVTMAEISKAKPHAPAHYPAVIRPIHVARRDGTGLAIAVDPMGRLHFDGGTVLGNHVVVLLSSEVPDSHLAELMADGVSYIVSPGPVPDLTDALAVLAREFGVKRLMLEGGGTVNGHFLAAGLVDEINILLAPALDAAPDIQGIVAFPGGLAGKCELSLSAITPRPHGVVQLSYRVTVPTDHKGSAPNP